MVEAAGGNVAIHPAGGRARGVWGAGSGLAGRAASVGEGRPLAVRRARYGDAL